MLFYGAILVPGKASPRLAVNDAVTAGVRKVTVASSFISESTVIQDQRIHNRL
jgi:hypothetical protein